MISKSTASSVPINGIFANFALQNPTKSNNIHRTDNPMYALTDIFDRSTLLLGEENMKKLNEKKVIIFGIGGVGSWTAEALIRTGLRSLTIVDADKVAVSNINRQVPATTETVGQSKTDAMRAHLLTINPQADINGITDIYTVATAEKYDLEEYDYVVDAIDSISDKALLIYNATRAKRPRLFSSMGAALKTDPARIKTGEFRTVTGCRLAAALRHRFKKTGMYPSKKFRCVFSEELSPNLGAETRQEFGLRPDQAPMNFNKKTTNGSLCHITAIFGMTLAGMIIRSIMAD